MRRPAIALPAAADHHLEPRLSSQSPPTRTPEQSVVMSLHAKNNNLRRLWIALGGFLALSALMYVSIIYKIINYGP
jgi:hypothetical protein